MCVAGLASRNCTSPCVHRVIFVNARSVRRTAPAGVPDVLHGVRGRRGLQGLFLLPEGRYARRRPKLPAVSDIRPDPTLGPQQQPEIPEHLGLASPVARTWKGLAWSQLDGNSECERSSAHSAEHPRHVLRIIRLTGRLRAHSGHRARTRAWTNSSFHVSSAFDACTSFRRPIVSSSLSVFSALHAPPCALYVLYIQWFKFPCIL